MERRLWGGAVARTVVRPDVQAVADGRGRGRMSARDTEEDVGAPRGMGAEWWGR